MQVKNSMADTVGQEESRGGSGQHGKAKVPFSFTCSHYSTETVELQGWGESTEDKM